MSKKKQIQALLTEEIDVAIFYAPIEKPQIITKTIVKEPLVVALPTNHQLAEQAILDMRSLANESFVLCPQDIKPELYNQILETCEQAGFQPNIIQESSPPEVLLRIVESGMGITLVAAGMETRHKLNVVYRPLKESIAVLEVVAAWRRGCSSQVLGEFMQVLQQIELPC